MRNRWAVFAMLVVTASTLAVSLDIPEAFGQFRGGGATGAGGGPPKSADEIFLKIDKIPGESTDAAHPGEIVVRAFDFGVDATPTEAGARPVPREGLSVQADSSMASPLLLESAASGRPLKSVVLTVRRTIGTQPPFEYLRITLLDATATSIAIGGSAGAERGHDEYKFSASVGKIEYVGQNDNGSSKPPVQAGWDISQNQKN